MQKKTTLTKRIRVTDEAGQELVVNEYTEFIYSKSLDSAGEWIKNLRRFRLGQEPVNLVDEDTFLRVHSGETLKRVG